MSTAKPGTGRRVVVTRAVEQAGQLVDELTELGFEVISIPVIQIDDPVDGGAALRRELRAVTDFSWVVVTSPNGAARLVDGLRSADQHRPGVGTAVLPTGVRLAAVGPGTARVLDEAGLAVDLVPARHTAEGLVAEFPDPPDRGVVSPSINTISAPTIPGPETPVADSALSETAVSGTYVEPHRVLVASADIARDVLPDGLRAKGWDVVVVDAYRTVSLRPTEKQAEQLADCDLVTFASGSAVRALVEAVGPERIPRTVVTIGPIASEAARAAGLDVTAEADPHTIDGLVEAVVSATSLS